jgi:hypothetical protein
VQNKKVKIKSEEFKQDQPHYKVFTNDIDHLKKIISNSEVPSCTVEKGPRLHAKYAVM